MFKKIKVLKKAVTNLYQYFTPSWHNCARTAGLLSATVLVPVATVCMPMIFFRKEEDSNLENKNNNLDLITALASVSIVALLNGIQKGLSIMLATSTMQAIRERNVKLLMDESKFLIHGNNKDIKSTIQYVTVGVGVRDFATNAIQMLVELPMCTVSSASTLMYISIITKSFTTSGIVIGFTSASAIILYLLGKGCASYEANNQKTENDLVAKIAFIESHRSAISLMGASETECSSVMQTVHKINSTIPKLALLSFSYFFLTNILPAISSKFLGGYYTDDSVKNLSNNEVYSLNVMIMTFLTNVTNIIYILTNNYAYIKLNLEQLQAFDLAYNDCLLTRNTHNKMKQEYEGDRVCLINFSVYRPDTENSTYTKLITIFNKVTLELLPNKIYQLSAESGGGKTTFLKAITNNWQYTDGVVKLPANAKDNLYFIPQHSFIPTGTLLEILTYPLKPQKFVVNNLMSALIHIDATESDTLSNYTALSSYIEFVDEAKYLLDKLLPDIIKVDELEAENINWNERLSGGEKQKIEIIRAILAKPHFIIMDEATSALNTDSKKIVYETIKESITESPNYTVIYTDHNPTENFADVILTISGQSLEYREL